jgi:type I restriction enzyme, S subunit
MSVPASPASSVALGDLVSFKTGKLDSNAAIPGGRFPFFTCSQQTLRTNTFAFDCECVLLAGNNAAGIFPIKYFHGKFDAYQRTYVIRPLSQDILDVRYLYYSLRLKLEAMRSLSTGATTRFLTLPILKSIEIKLPPLATQDKIAAVLSAYDDLIENNNHRIKLLEEMARRIYREWFIDFRYPNHEGVRFVASELGSIPQSWRVQSLSGLVSTQYGYTESATTHPVGPQFLRGMDINKTSYIDWSAVPYCPISAADHEKYKLLRGDVVVIRMADPGKVGIVEADVDAVFASYLIRVRPLNELVLPYFLFYFMSSDRYQGFVNGASTGTTRKSLSAPLITSIALAVPPPELQHAFVDRITPLRDLMSGLTRTNTNLRATRDLLLPRLISGGLDVSDLDIAPPEAAA